MREAQERVRRLFEIFPGVVANAGESEGSRVEPDDRHVLVDVVYTDDIHGHTASLVVDYILGKLKLGRLPARCSPRQIETFAGYFGYASPLAMGKARPHHRLANRPLSVLLAHVLLALTRDSDEASGSGPTLAEWSNVLRPLGDDAVTEKEFAERSILATRALRVVLRDGAAIGWLEIGKGRGRTVRLSDKGRRARSEGRARLQGVEQSWRDRFGEARVERLRAALAAIAERFEVELPHYLTGYGPGDPSLTGGPYVAEDPGPPRIPAHGEEWPIVKRREAVNSLPLSALLSKVLTAFTIDYERARVGGLGRVSRFSQFVPDEGVPLVEAQRLGGVTGSGSSAPERHLFVVVEPGKKSDGTRRVYLTPKGKIERDAYPGRVIETEQEWRADHGADVMEGLRTVLESIDDELDDDLPNFPDTTSWFRVLRDQH